MDQTAGPGVISMRVKKIIRETDDARSFVLERTDGFPILYTTGQFLTFIFHTAQGREERRNYSISSVPGEPATITIRRIPNGEFSRYMIDTFKEGDLLQTIGASGFFTLPEDANAFQQYVFFAAGSGITPVFALIKKLLRDHPRTKILLVYSNRNLASAIFYSQLNALRDTYADRLHIEFLFSDATHISRKRLGIYVIHEILNTLLVGKPSEPIFYLCGPFEYMRMITIVLLSNGVPASHIRKEIFVVEKNTRTEEPPDTDPHTVTVERNGQTHRFTVQYPDTILQTAKKLNIPLPYSCEAGQCGTCAANCISGKVWMLRNDVLMNEEVAKGRVLTCTGFPINGDVHLTI